MALFRVPKIEWDTAPNTLEFGYPMDAAVSWEDPQDGSQFVVSPAGVRDSWIVGDQPMLSGAVRWLPTTNIADTGFAPFTGWDGATGWREFLKFARDMNTFLFFPDRDIGTSISSYIVLPLRGAPPLDKDGTRRIQLVIASASASTYDDY